MFRNGFLRTHCSIFSYLFRLSDLTILYGLGVITYTLNEYLEINRGTVNSAVLVAILAFVLIAEKLDLYQSWRGRRLSSEIALVSFIIILISLGLSIIAPFIVSQPINSKFYIWLMTWGAVGLMGLSAFRIVVRSLLKTVRSLGWNDRRVLLVGGNHIALDILDVLQSHPEYGLCIVGYVDDRSVPRVSGLSSLNYLGSIKDIEKIAKQYDVNQVWITFPAKGESRARKVLEALKFSTVSTRYVLDLGICKESEKSLTIMMGGIPLLDLDVSPLEGPISQLIKDVEDKVLAALVLFLLSPLFLILAIGVKMSSRGPIFYKQTRISWNNEPFEMLKFRSMPVDVERETGPRWASAGENRATKFGAFLRRTSLDELPQFINVLKGEMSIVGPRPERPEFVEKFKNEIPDYMKKHMVKAGITGWAQVNGYRGNTDLGKRIEHDLYYIKNWTPLFDIQIAIQTMYKGFVSKHAY